jgi:hypothetical protein
MMLLLAAGHASAQEAPRGQAPEVSLEVRAQARALFLEGNKLLKIPLFAEAADKYQQALALWPHPAFYYNLVIAQLNLVQPVEAYHSLEKALEHGPRTLGEQRYQQGLKYRAQLHKQLGFVTVRCDDEGAEVRLDGQLVLTGPGNYEAVLLPGGHQIVASKSGHVPEAREITLSPGQRMEVSLRLRMPDRIETERYVPAWAPWLGMGAGVALISTGAYFDWRSSAGLSAYEDDFRAQCPFGCTDVEAPELAGQGSNTDAGERTAVGLYIAGGAVLMGSAIMIYVNRERVMRSKARPDAVSLTPMWSPRAAGLVLTGEF